MNEGLAEYQEKLRAGLVERSTPKTPWEKSRASPTLRNCVTAKCCDCMGWEEHTEIPTGLHKDVRYCTSVACPLYSVRPWQKTPD